VVGTRKRREVVRKVGSVARSRYGNLRRRKVRPALDQLVLSLLCRYTSPSRATRALRQLKRAFVDWNEVRVSSAAEVAVAVSTTDWAVVCAERAKEILTSIFKLCNEVALTCLAELTPPQARTFLQSLDGMERDLADEVLLFSCNVELLPVGESAARVCYRLGLIRSDRATMDSQKRLMSFWDPALYPNLALFFLSHAESVCKRDGPNCDSCSLRGVCPRTGVEEPEKK